jgi:hypothetical protein
MARPFGDVPLTDEEHLLDLNVRAVLALSHAAVTAMVPRGHGQIINISSVAPMVPRAVTATYSASKAWVTSFTESLALRLAGTGVTATVVCPGLTRSEFHQRSGEDVSGRPALLWLRPERVVAEALAAANAGRILNVPSRRYRLLMLLAQHAPRSVVRAVTAQR